MLQSKALNIGGLLAAVVVTPVLAVLASVDLDTVLTLEHSSGSLLVSSGLVAFLLLARLEGEDKRTVIGGSLLFIAGIAAFLLRGAIVQDVATSANPPQAGLNGIRIALMIIFYLALAIGYIRYILSEPQPQAPQTAHVVRWAEANRPE